MIRTSRFLFFFIFRLSTAKFTWSLRGFGGGRLWCFEWGAEKAIAIFGAQMLPQDDSRELYHSFCKIVGGVLSPLLSNILLDDLDKELERRGHKFCRYADDCNIYVRSQQGGERVMASITNFLEKKLRLKVNAEKSAVARPWERKFLGYSMRVNKQPRLKPSKNSIQRLKDKIRAMICKGRGRNLKQVIKELSIMLRGWIQYYRLAKVKSIFKDLGEWIRRKSRSLIWIHWKRPSTRAKGLIKRGLEEAYAGKCVYHGKGPWRNSGAPHMEKAFPNAYFLNLGLVSLTQQLQRIQFST